MIRPRRPLPRGGAPIRALGGHADRDEALDPPGCVDDAECRVVSPDEVADALDDQLQDGLDVEDLGDGPGRLDERLEFGDAKDGALGGRLDRHARHTTSP